MRDNERNITYRTRWWIYILKNKVVGQTCVPVRTQHTIYVREVVLPHCKSKMTKILIYINHGECYRRSHNQR